jgi:hypothetical protein
VRQCIRRFGTHSSTSLEPRLNTQHPGAVSVVPVAAGTEPDQPMGILLELLGAVRLLPQAEECWQQPRQPYCQHRTSTVICACSDLRVQCPCGGALHTQGAHSVQLHLLCYLPHHAWGWPSVIQPLYPASQSGRTPVGTVYQLLYTIFCSAVLASSFWFFFTVHVVGPPWACHHGRG